MTIDKLMNKNVDGMVMDFELVGIWDKILAMGYLEDKVKIVRLETGIVNTYVGDLFGLLNNELGIVRDAWYVIMKLNGYDSSVEYDGREWLLIPDPDAIEDILEKIKNR